MLGDLEDSISGFIPPQDPESFETYEYIVLEPLSFELCAVFNIESTRIGALSVEEPIRYSYPKGLYQQSWVHDKGRVCFERTIDPELYRQERILEEPIPKRAL